MTIFLIYLVSCVFLAGLLISYAFDVILSTYSEGESDVNEINREARIVVRTSLKNFGLVFIFVLGILIPLMYTPQLLTETGIWKKVAIGLISFNFIGLTFLVMNKTCPPSGGSYDFWLFDTSVLVSKTGFFQTIMWLIIITLSFVAGYYLGDLITSFSLLCVWWIGLAIINLIFLRFEYKFYYCRAGNTYENIEQDVLKFDNIHFISNMNVLSKTEFIYSDHITFNAFIILFAILGLLFYSF